MIAWGRAARSRPSDTPRRNRWSARKVFAPPRSLFDSTECIPAPSVQGQSRPPCQSHEQRLVEPEVSRRSPELQGIAGCGRDCGGLARRASNCRERERLGREGRAVVWKFGLGSNHFESLWGRQLITRDASGFRFPFDAGVVSPFSPRVFARTDEGLVLLGSQRDPEEPDMAACRLPRSSAVTGPCV